MYLRRYVAIVYCVIFTGNCAVAENSIRQDSFSKVTTCFNPSTTCRSPLKVKTAHLCAVWCMQTETCKSYSVERATQMCYLNYNLLIDNGCVNDFKHFNTKMAVDNSQCLNGGEYNQADGTCRCFNSYVGERCERIMHDCSDGFVSGHYDGMVDIFTIHPPTSPSLISVRCQMKYTGKTTILHRHKDQPYVNFTRDWNDYKIGFGNMTVDGNHYIGNEAIHFITVNRKQNMLINAIFDTGFQQFTHTGVQVACEKDNYRLTFESKWPHPKNPLGDCFPGNNIYFSTIDRDNDASPGICALTHMSGWWFDDCGPCNPTGKMQADSGTTQGRDLTSLFVETTVNLPAKELTVYLWF